MTEISYTVQSQSREKTKHLRKNFCKKCQKILEKALTILFLSDILMPNIEIAPRLSIHRKGVRLI